MSLDNHRELGSIELTHNQLGSIELTCHLTTTANSAPQSWHVTWQTWQHRVHMSLENHRELDIIQQTCHVTNIESLAA